MSQGSGKFDKEFNTALDRVAPYVVAAAVVSIAFGALFLGLALESLLVFFGTLFVGLGLATAGFAYTMIVITYVRFHAALCRKSDAT